MGNGANKSKDKLKESSEQNIEIKSLTNDEQPANRMSVFASLFQNVNEDDPKAFEYTNDQLIKIIANSMHRFNTMEQYFTPEQEKEYSNIIIKES